MSSKGKGRTLELEQMRKAEEKAASQSAEVRKKSSLTIMVIIAVVAGLGAWVMFAPAPPGVAYPNQGNFHLSSLDEPHAAYNSTPPSSGPHFGSLGAWGVAEVPIPPELFIHNLEDAGVVFVYNCPDGCDEVVSGLATLLDERSESTLMVTSYDGLIRDPDGKDYQAAAIAWGRVLYFDDVEASRAEIDDFIGLYHGIDHHVSVAPTHG